MFQKQDKVLYEGKEYEILHVYEGTGFLEISDSTKCELVHPNDVTKIVINTQKPPERKGNGFSFEVQNVK